MSRWQTQDNNQNAVVKVSSDGIHSGQVPVASEFIIQEKGPGGEHLHLGFDEAGNQIFEQLR